MITDKPLISIIIVVYNDVLKIKKTLESIISQTFNDFEIIVIDGGSKDGTVEVISKYLNKIKYFISEIDHGIYDAENKGANYANGEWIFYLLSGDTFTSNTSLGEIAPYLQNKPLTNIIFTKNVNNNLTYNQSFNFFYLLRKNICQQTIFYRTQFLHQYPFDINLRFASDMKFIFDNYISIKFEIINVDLVRYDITGISSQSKNIIAIWEERIFSIKNSNLPFLRKFVYLLYSMIVYRVRKYLL